VRYTVAQVIDELKERSMIEIPMLLKFVAECQQRAHCPDAQELTLKVSICS
jgi:hypothetical protein